MMLTITEISKENGASRVVKIGNHALRCYAHSRLTRLIWVPSSVTENPFATLEKVYCERNVKVIVSFSIHSKRSESREPYWTPILQGKTSSHTKA